MKTKCPRCGMVKDIIGTPELLYVSCSNCHNVFSWKHYEVKMGYPILYPALPVNLDNSNQKMDKSNEDIDELVEALNIASNGGLAKQVIINNFSSTLSNVIKNNRSKLTKEDKTEIRNYILSVAELFEDSPKRKNGTRS